MASLEQNIRWLVISIMLLVPYVAQAQFGFNANNTKEASPIEIVADETIEWVRDQKKYIARGNAEALQEGYKVKADELIADYKETEEQGTKVWRFTANGHVKITTNEYIARAEKAVYNVEKDYTLLIGNDIIIRGSNATLTAKEKIEFFGDEKKAIDYNRPKIIQKTDQGERSIEADIILGFFEENKEGALALSLVKAQGNVLVTTDVETLRGEMGVYDVNNGQAVVTGSVKITRGSSQLNGEKATLDIKAGTSVLYALADESSEQTSTERQRVKGLFYLGDNQ